MSEKYIPKIEKKLKESLSGDRALRFMEKNMNMYAHPNFSFLIPMQKHWLM